MKNILITGSTGFIGSHIRPLLQQRYKVSAPTRKELNLLESDSVRQYLEQERFDAVIHLANPTAQNPVDKYCELFERSLCVFMSLLHCSNLYGKMIYLGSGAEYGKHRAIAKVSETDFGRELPHDPYGLSRYIMSELTENRDNIINLRVFGCYGSKDPPYKLLPYVMSRIIQNEPIELRTNTRFDFLYVRDIAPVLIHFIENNTKNKVYNLCSGEPIMTGDFADIARRLMNADVPITYQRAGDGLEYTGNNSRLRAEIPEWQPRSIQEGIRETIENENWQI